MSVVPTTHTFLGSLATSSEMNTYVRDVLNFVQNPPICQVRQTVIQSIPNNTWTALTFTGGEDFDQALGAASTHHSESVNTSRITALWPGVYWCSGVAAFAANATGIRGARLAKNGTAIDFGCQQLSASSANLTCIAVPAVQIYLGVDEYVELFAYQNSTAALNTSVVSTAQSGLSVMYASR